MPKMKTNSGAKKRFRVTASGQIKYKQSNTRHRLMSRPTKMKRKARGTDILNEADSRIVQRNYLPYARKRKSKTSHTSQEA